MLAGAGHFLRSSLAHHPAQPGPVALTQALPPSSETLPRKTVDDAFTEDEAEAEGEGDRSLAQGTSVAPPKPMCPQCALAARRPPGDVKKAKPEDPARHQ